MASRRDAPHVSELFFKTRPCRFFLRGHCTKGAACNFAHGRADQRQKANLQCTKLCLLAKGDQQCGNPECRYAHSKAERRFIQLPPHIRQLWQDRFVERMAKLSLAAEAPVTQATSDSHCKRRRTRARRVQKHDISRKGASTEPMRPPKAFAGIGMLDSFNGMSALSMIFPGSLFEPSDEEPQSGSELGDGVGSGTASWQQDGKVKVSDMDDDTAWLLVEHNTFLTYQKTSSAIEGSKSEPVRSTGVPAMQRP